MAGHCPGFPGNAQGPKAGRAPGAFGHCSQGFTVGTVGVVLWELNDPLDSEYPIIPQIKAVLPLSSTAQGSVLP